MLVIWSLIWRIKNLRSFCTYGEIVSATIIMDRISGRSKGFGFVEFAKDEDADEARDALTEKN